MVRSHYSHIAVVMAVLIVREDNGRVGRELVALITTWSGCPHYLWKWQVRTVPQLLAYSIHHGEHDAGSLSTEQCEPLLQNVTHG